MRNSNLKINGNCVQCGSCLGCGFDFLSSADDGSICVATGTFLEENGKEISALREICPTDSFELTNEINKTSVLKKLVKELKEFEDISEPTKEQLRFNKEDYYIPIPCASGEYRYEYSSSNAAERAALNEFDRVMYSQINTIILRIITAYRIKVVKPFFSNLTEDGSIYAEKNKKLSDILDGIKKILGNKLPEDFAEISIFPDRDTLGIWKMLNRGELISNDLVATVKNEFGYSASQYSCYWTWSETEISVGTDWRGNLKYKDMYCYKNIDKAFNELAKDLMKAFEWAQDDIEDTAVRLTRCLVKKYNEMLSEVIKQKVQMIDKIK